MDARGWRQQRRDCTRRLIELGRPVVTSRLPEHLVPLEPDLHATLLGMLKLADTLEHAQAAPARTARWREGGRRTLRET